MFSPYPIDELRPGKQTLCSMKMMYYPGLRIDGITAPFNVYVRCYVAKIGYDKYMATFCDRSLRFSRKFYVRIFNSRNLPPLYKLPFLWALTDNVITFNEEDRMDFVKNLDGDLLHTVDLFDGKDCIDRMSYIEVCKQNKCEAV